MTRGDKPVYYSFHCEIIKQKDPILLIHMSISSFYLWYIYRVNEQCLMSNNNKKTNQERTCFIKPRGTKCTIVQAIMSNVLVCFLL